MDVSRTSDLRALTALKSKKQEFSLLCAYSLDSLDPNVYDDSLERICNRLRTWFLLEMATAADGAVLDKGQYTFKSDCMVAELPATAC